MTNMEIIFKYKQLVENRENIGDALCQTCANTLQKIPSELKAYACDICGTTENVKWVLR